MDIYKNKASWKLLLGIVGAIIVLISMVYSQYLAGKLAEREQNNVKIYIQALEVIKTNATSKNFDPNDRDYILASDIAQKIYPSMSMVTESEDGIYEGHHIGGFDETKDQEFLAKRVAKIKASGVPPIEGFPGYAKFVYYEKSRLYHLIRWFPLAQIFLLGTFIFFSYYLFSASRKSEQNRVWAGMAKETAHQLGTPISAILGWIEHLKELAADNAEQTEVVSELRNDVTRLELIADRFSKIGSKPELEKVNLNSELEGCMQYMKRRAPKKVQFSIKSDNDEKIDAKINSHLFDWVIENILRNALDAMSGEGNIDIVVSKNSTKAIINITDSGKGITPQNIKTVFNPGFTTKKRGWGLGLSLAKRIIENYHNGKIFVKHSKINEGTTFEIQLPLA